MSVYPKKLDCISKCVYLSDWRSATDEDLLANHKISAIICVNNLFKSPEELSIYKKLGILHFHINAEDSEYVDLKKWFAKTIEIMEYYVSRNKNILVHCTAGISRSVTIVLAYLIYLSHCCGSKRPSKPIIHNLYKYVCTKRDVALPNPGFYSQLVKFELECMY